jgi:hypothetical protein
MTFAFFRGLPDSKLLRIMAGTTGLEPATSAVTGQRSNQLNYVPTRWICNFNQPNTTYRLHGLQINR